jgi:hypothetical protein
VREYLDPSELGRGPGCRERHSRSVA